MSLEHDLWYLCTEITKYEIFEDLAHTVVIGRKTVKWRQNTVCDACALKSRRYEILKVFAHTVVNKP